MALAPTLRLHAAETPDAPAILAPGRPPLTFAGLSAHVESLARALAGGGFVGDNVVAAVLPDDAEGLCAFLGISSVACFAPLNPALQAEEFESCLKDLCPSALLVPAGARSPAVGAAEALGIAILESHSAPEHGAGAFMLTGLNQAVAAPNIPDPSAVALSLLTSATTGRAKCVCITHGNVEAMALASAQAMMLGRTDRFLSMMPLFHLQGLLSAFAQLMVGGSVVCAASFDADRFPVWIDELQPTWYTAGPALHRTILALCREKPELAMRSRLRFVRSIGAALPAALLRELEETLRVPVLEGYGLTEVGAVTSTPLVPYASKAGSAGIRIVPGVEIMDEAGNLLPAGHVGEIVVRGPNVMRGYRNNPEATRAAFRNGWFRTGDLGRFDSEGFLYVTGRLKEFVNRGGEKILLQEIDRALMAHPVVADAAAFAIPHPQLGEDLAAAVVLREGERFDESALRDFLAARLAVFKVPRVFMIVDGLPRGASGKVQRVRLAEEFAELQRARATAAAAVAPRTDCERRLAGIWAAVLGIPTPGIDEDFFELGGHSLASTRILARIEQAFGLTLRHDALLAAPTVRRLAVLLQSANAQRERIVAIQPEGSKPAFFMVRPLPIFRPLAGRLGKERPFLGVVMPRLEELAGGSDVPSVACQLVSVVRQQQPSGPYHLGGWCADGLLAFEMAQQLAAAGERVALLALFDTPNPALLRRRSLRLTAKRLLGMLRWRMRFQLASVRQLAMKEVPAHVGERMVALGGYVVVGLRALLHPDERARYALSGIHHPSGIRLRISNYQHQTFPGRLTLFRAAGRPTEDPSYGWDGAARDGLTVHTVPGDHLTMFLEPNVDALARKLAAELERVDGVVSPSTTFRK